MPTTAAIDEDEDLVVEAERVGLAEPEEARIGAPP